MKRVQLPDAKSGVPVFEWLIPADWEFEGAVRWRDSVAMPALIGFRAWNPAGSEQIECLPQIPSTWTRNAITQALGRFAPKRRLIKMDGLEHREPMTSREALRELVVPRYRGRTADQRAGRMRGGPLGLLDTESLARQVPAFQQYMQGVQQRWQMLQKGVLQRDLAPVRIDDGRDIVRSCHHNGIVVLYSAEGDEQQALAVLAKSIALAEPGGFLRLFVDLGPSLIPLLRKLARRGVSPVYINDILAAFGTGEALPSVGQLISTPPVLITPGLAVLTARELEVLELLGKRYTDKEIADALSISVETVHTHVRHISHKLDVRGRRAIVQAAKDQRLLV